MTVAAAPARLRIATTKTVNIQTKHVDLLYTYPPAIKVVIGSVDMTESVTFSLQQDKLLTATTETSDVFGLCLRSSSSLRTH